MADVRVFSYLPNPRLWKSTIAARICGVTVEIIGAKPPELQGWLWDFDARPLTDAEKASDVNARPARTGFGGNLYKTDAFLEAHPFGTVPAGFSGDGTVGIFESNSIMRSVARLGGDDSGLYGDSPFAASRIDSFLDVSLVFASASQTYLLSLGGESVTREIYDQAEKAFGIYMRGIDNALSPDRDYLVGDKVTLADICFVCELTLFRREMERLPSLAPLNVPPLTGGDLAQDYPHAMAHYDRLCTHPAFAPDLGPFLERLAKAA